MRFVIQVVSEAEVKIDKKTKGKIGKGYMILVGVGQDDDEQIADRMVNKLLGLRIFPDENGKTVITKDTKIAVPTLPGKGDRPAVRMYTDWRMLHKEFDEEWSGIIMSIGDMIKAMDCAINITDHPAAGCYVDESMYNDAKARAEKNS